MTKKRIREILQEARSKISTRRHWTRGRLSRKRPDGAVQYCAIGAIFAATEDKNERAAAIEALAAGVGLTPHPSNYQREGYGGRDDIESWNDRGSWEKVDAGFEQAIKALR